MRCLKPVAFSGKSVVLIRYLPVLAVGVLLVVLSLLAFDVAASYMLDFLSSMPGRGENSINFLWPILLDTCQVLILSASAYYGYRTLLPKFPVDLYAAILMQLPMTYVSLYLMPPSFNFGSLFSSAQSVTAIVSSVSVLVVYSLSKCVRQRV
ncbi:hypothetical protein [Shewanella atlantica]|uniref:hypothetical protein n=1 Tax=Shewanella atlantica TaxID=271099 RepID=UPI003736AC95